MFIGYTCKLLSFFPFVFSYKFFFKFWWGLQSESKRLKIWNFELHFFWTLKPTKNINNIWILILRVDISPVSLLLIYKIIKNYLLHIYVKISLFKLMYWNLHNIVKWTVFSDPGSVWTWRFNENFECDFSLKPIFSHMMKM